jgi:AbiV family abortive infection protein
MAHDKTAHTFEQALLQNAGRLIEDAELLLEHKRFATASSIAILGLEELGKYVYVQINLSKEIKAKISKIGLHKKKQMAIAAIGLDVEFMRIALKYKENKNEKLNHLINNLYAEIPLYDDVDATNETQFIKRERNCLAIAEWIVSNIDDFAEMHRVAFCHSRPNDLIAPLTLLQACQSGHYAKEKNLGFYADERETPKQILSKNENLMKSSSMHCSFARTLLNFLKSDSDNSCIDIAKYIFVCLALREKR